MKCINLIVSSVLVAVLCSCKKDDEPMARQKTRPELITAGSWRVSSYTVNPAADVNGDGVKETDVYANMESCERDNRVTFYLTGAGQIDEGPTKCDPADEQITLINWSFSQDESSVTIDGILYEIVSLGETELRVRQSEVIGSDTYTHTIMFVH